MKTQITILHSQFIDDLVMQTNASLSYHTEQGHVIIKVLEFTQAPSAYGVMIIYTENK